MPASTVPKIEMKFAGEGIPWTVPVSSFTCGLEGWWLWVKRMCVGQGWESKWRLLHTVGKCSPPSRWGVHRPWSLWDWPAFSRVMSKRETINFQGLVNKISCIARGIDATLLFTAPSAAKGRGTDESPRSLSVPGFKCQLPLAEKKHFYPQHPITPMTTTTLNTKLSECLLYPGTKPRP